MKVETTAVNLSGHITEARDQFRAPFAFTQCRLHNQTLKLIFNIVNHSKSLIINKTGGNRQTTSKGAKPHERTCQFEIHKI